MDHRFYTVSMALQFDGITERREGGDIFSFFGESLFGSVPALQLPGVG
jgi:hypothetical protein